MYIKNRQNSSKFKAFGSSNFVLNRKFSTSKLPTFHILKVISNDNCMKKILIIAAVVIIGVILYLNYLVKEHDLRPLHKYEDIQIPVGLDCSSVRLGNFETEKSYIERTESKQIQTNKATGDKKEFYMDWKSNCEYVLTSVNDESEVIRIKITAVNPDNYGCYVISDKYADNYPNFLSITRVKKSL